MQWTNCAPATVLAAIHQCVQYTLVTYVLDAPLPLLLQYLSETPFYRGADQLYYLMLQKYGTAAYYAADGRHLVTVNCELAMVYVLAEQDLTAVATLGGSATIADAVATIVPRMVTSPAYATRMHTITGTVSLQEAMTTPRAALCVDTYLEELRRCSHTVMADFATHVVSLEIVNRLLTRCCELKATCPDLWALVLAPAFHRQLEKLQLRRILQGYPVMVIKELSTIFPDLLQCPSHWGVLPLKLWFCERRIRGYLLGYDLDQGCPSNVTASQRLSHLNTVGVEAYVKEITGVHLTADNRLTGYVGQNYYAAIAGKQLGNVADSYGTPIGWYYPYDVIPLVYDDIAYLVPLHEFKRTNEYSSLTQALMEGMVAYLPGAPSADQIKLILRRLRPAFTTLRSIPVLERLLEVQCLQ